MQKSVGDYCYVATLLPFTQDLKIDEPAYRRFLRHFLDNERFRARGGLCINAEAGEIFTLTREEKRRVLEIAMEENNGAVPLISGTFALSTAEVVDTARDVSALGADGLFVTPPGGAQDIASCWDANKYPEVWADQIIAQVRAVDMPVVTHPAANSPAPFTPGIPVEATVAICNQISNIVGWKMMYGYEGFRLVAKALRKLPRRVSVMAAAGGRFHEYRATNMFDGTLSGFFNYALEPMLDHLQAWDERDLDRACAIWNEGGLSHLQETISDKSRLHIRYKTAAWLRGLIPNPFMRPPMPAPKQAEIDAIYEALQGAGLSVIERKDASLAVYR